MIVGLAHTALLVREYEEAKAFYCGKLGFEVVEDTPLPNKRWIRLRAPGKKGSEILLSRAVDDKQRASIGDQTGGRVLFFLHTDDLKSDHQRLSSQGIEFTEGPFEAAYGTVAVFKDLYGNRIDLIEPKPVARQPLDSSDPGV
jgi:catechol 2,3-dioxygenase-like lactoylglutathione lyase family enzyme